MAHQRGGVRAETSTSPRGALVQNERGEFLTASTLVWRLPKGNLRELLRTESVVERESALEFLHDPRIAEELGGMPAVTNGLRWRVWRVSVAPRPSGWKK
ncbi:hypothetical protein L0Y40_01675 [Candidatus Wolfebacteria bacterium]|nr:hypothetical protein [Candidatus Wolfebacteria bacterium]